MPHKNKLKTTRQKRKLSQQAVANAAGLGIRLYQYYEAGEKTPGVYIAIQIAKALNCSVEELFPIDD